MNSSKPKPPSGAAASSSTPTTATSESSGKKVRKPYTITKSRESWTEEEHDKFLEALQLFDRDWKKIEDFVGSKTVIQIRSHAQKYFLKVQKNGTSAHVPPPRPKRKATHPYPQKAPKNVLMPLPVTMAYSSSLHLVAPGYTNWKDSSVLINTASSRFMSLQDDHNLSAAEDDAGSKGITRVSNDMVGSGVGRSNRMLNNSELTEQGKGSTLGIPDFAEVYGFIGSVFDPDTKDHVQKLKEMDPINFETGYKIGRKGFIFRLSLNEQLGCLCSSVLLLMRNLTVNISSPDFGPVREVLSSYDVGTRTVPLSAGGVAKNQANVLST